MSIDTVEYKISDKYGKWLGRGLGNMKDNYLIFNQNMMFNKEGVYKTTNLQTGRNVFHPRIVLNRGRVRKSKHIS